MRHALFVAATWLSWTTGHAPLLGSLIRNAECSLGATTSRLAKTIPKRVRFASPVEEQREAQRSERVERGDRKKTVWQSAENSVGRTANTENRWWETNKGADAQTAKRHGVQSLWGGWPRPNSPQVTSTSTADAATQTPAADDTHSVSDNYASKSNPPQPSAPPPPYSAVPPSNFPLPGLTYDGPQPYGSTIHPSFAQMLPAVPHGMYPFAGQLPGPAPWGFSHNGTLMSQGTLGPSLRPFMYSFTPPMDMLQSSSATTAAPSLGFLPSSGRPGAPAFGTALNPAVTWAPYAYGAAAFAPPADEKPAFTPQPLQGSARDLMEEVEEEELKRTSPLPKKTKSSTSAITKGLAVLGAAALARKAAQAAYAVYQHTRGGGGM